MMMGKEEEKEERIPLFVHSETKPEDVLGSKWIPKYHYQNRSQIVGWRRVSASNLQDLPVDELPDPVMPPEVRRRIREEAQQEAGVGSHASRSEAGMRRAEERAERAINEARGQSED